MRELEASLQQFGEFLLKARLVKEKAAPYCVRWVRRFLTRPASDEPLADQVRRFCEDLEREGRWEEWQVRQAEHALRIYFVNFLQRTDWQCKPASTVVDEQGHASPLAAPKAIDVRTYLIVLLAGEAGLRSGEIVALEWADLDLAKRLLCVQRNEWEGQVDSTKGGRLRYVPMTARLTAALRHAQHLRGPRVIYRDDGKPFTEGTVAGAVRRVARRAGLPGNGPHRLRHTFCSHLAMRGAPPRAIQELAGHANFTTTQRYMHLSPSAIEGAIRMLESAGVPFGRGNIVATGNGEFVNLSSVTT